MKKYILILIFIFAYGNTYADNVEYSNPRFDVIDEFLSNNDIEPGYNPQPNHRIWVYEPYVVDGVDTQTAEKFCSLLGYTYVNHILSNTTVNRRSALYFTSGDTWWDYNRYILRYSTITCDDGQGSDWTGTGSTGTGTTNIVINNIDNDPGINKEVFDEATLIEIYKYEALIMVFILLYTFFMRVIGARPKKVPKIWV